MPRITDEQRDARRTQILDAARACVAEHGLEAVSVEMIIARSGLSTGSVYRHFKGKDDIIAAAVVNGTAGLIDALQPVLEQDPPPPLPALMQQVLRKTASYSKRGDVDLRHVALHGWSHSQTDPELKATVETMYSGVRRQYGRICKTWQATDQFDPDVDPNAVAQLLLSITLGFSAQHALAGGADINAHVKALSAIASNTPNR